MSSTVTVDVDSMNETPVSDSLVFRPGAKFSLKRKEFPFSLEDENGDEERYVLREMNGAERESYLSTLPARASTTAEGKTIVKNFKGMNRDILGRCIFKEGVNKPVNGAEIDTWPSSLLEMLVEEAMRMNGLNKKGEEEEKND